MLLDSNIIIYAAQPAHTALRQMIAEQAPAVSIISVIEVLGYHRLPDDDQQMLERFSRAADVLPPSDRVVEWAIRLRQRRRMTLGDAIVAGTALASGRVLITHNTDDFRWITEIQLVDPLADHT